MSAAVCVKRFRAAGSPERAKLPEDFFERALSLAQRNRVCYNSSSIFGLRDMYADADGAVLRISAGTAHLQRQLEAVEACHAALSELPVLAYSEEVVNLADRNDVATQQVTGGLVGALAAWAGAPQIADASTAAAAATGSTAYGAGSSDDADASLTAGSTHGEYAAGSGGSLDGDSEELSEPAVLTAVPTSEASGRLQQAHAEDEHSYHALAAAGDANRAEEPAAVTADTSDSSSQDGGITAEAATA